VAFSKGIYRFSHIISTEHSTTCSHFRGGVQRRFVWALERLGVAACLACVAAAAAVDWQARQSCRLVWCNGVNLPPDKCVLRRSVSSGRTATPDVRSVQRPVWLSGRLNSHRPHQTRQNSPVCVVSGVAMWISYKAARRTDPTHLR